MNRIVILVLSFFLTTVNVFAQKISADITDKLSLTAGANYTFKDNIAYGYYTETGAWRTFDGTVEGGAQVNVGAEYIFKSGLVGSATYYRQNTFLRSNIYSPENETTVRTDYDMKVNYLMFGGTRYFPMEASEKIKPYAGLMIGMAIMNFKDVTGAPIDGKTMTDYTDTKFAWGLKAGIDIELKRNLSLRLEGSMISAAQASAGMTIGTGGPGAALGTSTDYYSLLQFNLGGVLVYKFAR